MVYASDDSSPSNASTSPHECLEKTTDESSCTPSTDPGATLFPCESPSVASAGEIAVPKQLSFFGLGLSDHRDPYELSPYEKWWRDHRDWLAERGYRMRARYMPGWAGPTSDRDLDGRSLVYGNVMDAVRISDGTFVAMKQVYKEYNPDEVSVHARFGMSELVGDPRNHCIPLYEILDVPGDPDVQVLVMPRAGAIDYPLWDTVGEAVDCIYQIIEGVAFLHERHYAHRDCHTNNIMMDIARIFPDSFHRVDPRRSPDETKKSRFYHRTSRVPRYWLIDFGLTRVYPPEDGPPRDYIGGGDRRSVPEYGWNDDALHDPFPVDVFYVGHWIQEEFIQRHRSNVFGFLASLANDMCAKDPTKRPKMSEVLERMETLIARTHSWTLRTRPRSRREPFWETPFRAVGHWCRQIGYVVTCTPAVPRRRPLVAAA